MGLWGEEASSWTGQRQNFVSGGSCGGDVGASLQVTLSTCLMVESCHLSGLGWGQGQG